MGLVIHLTAQSHAQTIRDDDALSTLRRLTFVIVNSLFHDSKSIVYHNNKYGWWVRKFWVKTVRSCH